MTASADGAAAEDAGRPRILRALLLLALTGGLLGISTNLAKVAGDWSIPPLAFLVWSLAGATAVLFAVGAARGTLPSVTRRTVEYFVVAAFVTVAASNLIFFSAVPVVGASFVALAIAFPPVLTYLGALTLRMEPFRLTRAAGVAAALAGAAVLALFELSAPDASALWIGLTLVGPVLLAIGNLYRTLRWPPGAAADALAPGMLLAATLMLFAAGALPAFSLALPLEARTIGLTFAQAGVFAGQFLMLFALQKAGGPVLLSLLGGVGAVVAVPVAILLLGEAPPEGLLYAVPLIALGVALVAWGGRKEADDG
jgi:drug/metabolite transporter (DMT)-like permease